MIAIDYTRSKRYPIDLITWMVIAGVFWAGTPIMKDIFVFILWTLYDLFLAGTVF